MRERFAHRRSERSIRNSTKGLEDTGVSANAEWLVQNMNGVENDTLVTRFFLKHVIPCKSLKCLILLYRYSMQFPSNNIPDVDFMVIFLLLLANSDMLLLHTFDTLSSS